jgi:hypothetical protein
MRQSYFPSTDAGLLAWARNMSHQLSVDPPAYGVSPERAEELADLVAEYDSAVSAASNRTTRSMVITSHKNDVRARFKDAARLIVSIVRGQPHLTDAQKIGLGITVPAPRKQAIPRPSNGPRLLITSMTGRTAQVLLTNAELESGRSKPPGVQGALIFIAAGDRPPAPGTGAWTFHSGTSRTKCRVTFPANLEPGTKVWICAAWVNARKQLGPPSMPAGTHIQFGAHIQFGESMGLAA